MELYIKVGFWIGVIAIALRLCMIATQTYPRDENHSLGHDVAFIFLQTGFVVWAGILLFA